MDVNSIPSTITPDHPNAVTLRHAYDVWGATGDPEPLAAACAEDIVWHISGNHSVSGDRVGRDGVREVLAKLLSFDDAEFCTTYDGVYANDDYGMVITGCSVDYKGEQLNWRTFDIFRFEEGLVKEYWTLAYPQAMPDKILA